MSQVWELLLESPEWQLRKRGFREATQMLQKRDSVDLELLLRRILEALEDPEKSVLQSAGECAAALAQVYSEPIKVWNVLRDGIFEQIDRHRPSSRVSYLLGFLWNIVSQYSCALSDSDKILGTCLPFIQSIDAACRKFSAKTCLHLLSFGSKDWTQSVCLTILISIKDVLLDSNPENRFSVLDSLSSCFNKKPDLASSSEFLPLIPVICINRYFPAQGISKMALSLWRQVVTLNSLPSGVDLLGPMIDETVSLYIRESDSPIPGGRESASLCILEICRKIPRDTLKVYVGELFQTSLKGCSDSHHLVRIASLTAISELCSEFAEELKHSFSEALLVCFEHLVDKNSTVREDSAIALVKICSVQPSLLDFLYRSCLSSFLELANSFSSRDDYACNVLKGWDLQLDTLSTCEAWLLCDGMVHVARELSKLLENPKIERLCESLLELCDMSAFDHEYCLKENIWIQLVPMFQRLSRASQRKLLPQALNHARATCSRHPSSGSCRNAQEAAHYFMEALTHDQVSFN